MAFIVLLADLYHLAFAYTLYIIRVGSSFPFFYLFSKEAGFVVKPFEKRLDARVQKPVDKVSLRKEAYARKL